MARKKRTAWNVSWKGSHGQKLAARCYSLKSADALKKKMGSSAKVRKVRVNA